MNKKKMMMANLAIFVVSFYIFLLFLLFHMDIIIATKACQRGKSAEEELTESLLRFDSPFRFSLQYPPPFWSSVFLLQCFVR